MNVKAVLLDLGGTLIRTVGSSETFRRILEAKGTTRSLEEIALAHKKVAKYMRRDTEEYAQLAEEFWNKWNSEILEILNIHENRELLVKALTLQWFDYSDVSLHPDVEEVLRGLKEKGVKIALVTNGLESDIEAILPKIGLTNFFDLTVASDTIGKPKPDSSIFVFALERLGVQAEDVLCIGDDLEKDCQAAQKVGIKSLLIDRENKLSEQWDTIQDLREVLTLIETPV